MSCETHSPAALHPEDRISGAGKEGRVGPEFHFDAVDNTINSARAKNGVRMPDRPPCSSVTVLQLSCLLNQE